MMIGRRLIATSLALVCALTLASCGGDDAAVTTTPTPTPSPDPNTQTTGSTPGASDVAAELGASGGTTQSVGGDDKADVPGLAGPLNSDGDLFDPRASFEETGPALGSEITEEEEQEAYEEEFDLPDETVVTEFTTAKISLDGSVYEATKGSVFPKDTQLFEVKSISATSVVIELVAGEFSNGSSGVTLSKGKTVSLVNQDEGLTMDLKLISVA